jgi:hypothetical protein
MQSLQPGFVRHAFRSTTIAHFGCLSPVCFDKALLGMASMVDTTGSPATEKHAILRKSLRFIVLKPSGYRHEAIGYRLQEQQKAYLAMLSP